MSPRKAAPPEDLLTAGQAGKRLGISKDQVHRLINMGLLTAIRLPGTGGRHTVRVEPEELERLKTTYRKAASA